MTPEIVHRAVWGLVLSTLSCVVGIIVLAASGRQSEASLTALATLGSGSAGALAGLLSAVTTPGAIIGGRRASDPHLVPPEVLDAARNESPAQQNA